MSEIINKVASSGIITLDLEELYPQGKRVVFDLKPLLWEEVALKEADLRAFVKEHDWAQYNDQFVSVHCSAVHVPRNAYVELSAKLLPVVKSLMFGEPCSTVPLYKAPKPSTS